MKYSYLFLTLFTLAGFVACNKCEECEDLYHEPTIKVVFFDSSASFKGDSIKVSIISFNGHTDSITNKGGEDSSVIGRKRAQYFFPLRLNSNQTTFYLEYLAYLTKIDTTFAADTIQDIDTTSIVKHRKRKFSLHYSLEFYYYNDRRLYRGLLDYNYNKDSLNTDSIYVSCNSCFTDIAQVNIYE